MHQMNVPTILWCEAVATACHLMKKTNSTKLKYRSPLEVLTRKKWSITHLKIFDCACYIHCRNIQDTS